MKTSDNGINLIKKFEGCVLHTYADSVGVLTIGYGHTSNVKKGMTITMAQATEYLRQDLVKFEGYVNKYVDKLNLNQNEFDALVSFAFNCGNGNLNKLLDNGKRTKQQIAEHITSYVYAGGKVLNGLVKRRAEEKKLFLTPVSQVVKTEPVKNDLTTVNFNVGKTYTTQVELVVRTEPDLNGKPIGYKKLTLNAKKNDKDKDGCVDKGTKVSCQKVVTDKLGNIWIKIPSGYICGYLKSKNEVYVK